MRGRKQHQTAPWALLALVVLGFSCFSAAAAAAGAGEARHKHQHRHRERHPQQQVQRRPLAEPDGDANPADIAVTAGPHHGHHGHRACNEDQLAVVLSHYKEEPSDVRQTIRRLRAFFPTEKPCVHVYTKGPLNTTELKSRLHVGDHFYQLENVGREGHSYLTYIIQHYHRLPQHVLFTQALPDRADTFWARTDEAARHLRNDSFACLGDKSTIHDCDQASIMGRVVRLREIWAMTQHKLCPPDIHACYRGQFLVNRQSIHKQTRGFYRLMQSYLEAPTEHWIHNDLRHIDKNDGTYNTLAEGVNTRDNTLFGHVLERMWMAIFDCQEDTIRHKDREWACAVDTS